MDRDPVTSSSPSLSIGDLRDRIAAFDAHTEGAIEGRRPAGISDTEWTALKVIARTGRVYCSAKTFADLRRQITGFDTFAGRAISPPILGAVSLIVDPRCADGYLYPDPREMRDAVDLRVRSEAILNG